MAPEQLLVVNGDDITPLSYAVEKNFDNPEFFEAVASLAPEAAIIVNQRETTSCTLWQHICPVNRRELFPQCNH